MKRTFRYRIYPTKGQKSTLTEWLNTCRILYNQSLSERKDAYERDKSSINYYDQANALKAGKRGNGYLTAVHSQVLQDVLKRLDKSFQHFFRRVKQGEEPGYPRFKSKDRFNSFTFTQSGFKIDAGKLILSKIGAIKLKQHREIPQEGIIKTCAIKRAVDQWYATFVVDLPDIDTEVEKKEIDLAAAVGIDLGLTVMATLSNGDKIDNPKWLRASEKKLAKEQRRLARKKKGSNNRKKQKAIVGTVHRRIRNQRGDFHHKLSNELVTNYDLIVFEDLTIRNMVKNKYLAKSISDAGWNQLISFTSYKAEYAGKTTKLVNPRRTSQECCICGNIQQMPLSQRVYHCSNCGNCIDRDHNAAINILNRGLGEHITVTAPQELGARACLSSLNGDAMIQEATQLVEW